MRCVVCGASIQVEPMTSHDEYKLYHCSHCDVHFWHPVTNPGPEWYEGAWSYRWASLLRSTYLRWDHRQFLCDRPAPGGRLLDVGCGAGLFLAAARLAGYDVYGVDFNPSLAEIARSTHHLGQVHADAFIRFAGQQPPRSYDVITCFQVLEHQDDVPAFMRSVVHLLRPGGCLALTVPNRERASHFWGPEDIPPHHLTRWNATSLANLCAQWRVSVVHLREQPVAVAEISGWLLQVMGVTDLGYSFVSWLSKCSSSTMKIGIGRDSLRTVALGGFWFLSKMLLPVAWALTLLLRRKGAKGPFLYLLGSLSHVPQPGAELSAQAPCCLPHLGASPRRDAGARPFTGNAWLFNPWEGDGKWPR